MPRIDHLWAYIVQDTGPDDEGVPAIAMGGMHYPLVAADGARLKNIREMAQDIANQTGKTLQLVRFTHREELSQVRPEGMN